MESVFSLVYFLSSFPDFRSSILAVIIAMFHLLLLIQLVAAAVSSVTQGQTVNLLDSLFYIYFIA